MKEPSKKEKFTALLYFSIIMIIGLGIRFSLDHGDRPFVFAMIIVWVIAAYFFNSKIKEK